MRDVAGFEGGSVRAAAAGFEVASVRTAAAGFGGASARAATAGFGDGSARAAAEGCEGASVRGAVGAFDVGAGVGWEAFAACAAVAGVVDFDAAPAVVADESHVEDSLTSPPGAVACGDPACAVGCAGPLGCGGPEAPAAPLAV